MNTYFLWSLSWLKACIGVFLLILPVLVGFKPEECPVILRIIVYFGLLVVTVAYVLAILGLTYSIIVWLYPVPLFG